MHIDAIVTIFRIKQYLQICTHGVNNKEKSWNWWKCKHWEYGLGMSDV